MVINRELLEKILSNNLSPFYEISKQTELWIWGAGNTSCLYQEGLKRIPEINNKSQKPIIAVKRLLKS